MTPADRTSSDQLAICAHDVRGALTVVTGYVSLLRRGGLTEEQRRCALDGIEKAIFRIDALLSDTLSGAHDVERGPERIDVSALAAQAAADASAAWNREVATAVPDTPALVRADPVALERVLENLLGNAAKYAPEGPIEVRVATDGITVTVEVADRGPGIPADQRARVLEPFERLERDEERPGTGLGLTVVRDVVERAGGSVTLLERAGGGAVVRLAFPAVGAG